MPLDAPFTETENSKSPEQFRALQLGSRQSQGEHRNPRIHLNSKASALGLIKKSRGTDIPIGASSDKPALYE
jgi:hypothetical protein